MFVLAERWDDTLATRAISIVRALGGTVVERQNDAEPERACWNPDTGRNHWALFTSPGGRSAFPPYSVCISSGLPSENCRRGTIMLHEAGHLYFQRLRERGLFRHGADEEEHLADAFSALHGGQPAGFWYGYTTTHSAAVDALLRRYDVSGEGWFCPHPIVTCVCLTTHPRRAKFLPDALRSYRAQTYAPRELVVVNDGAPLVSRADDVRVLNLPERGKRWTIGEKRNAGIRAARGEYLATWDDDDVSFPERLSAQVAAALAWGADVVRADGMFVADAGLALAGRCGRDAGRPVMPSALIRRDAAVRAGGYPAADFMEDAALIERIRHYVRGRVFTMPNARWYVMRRHGKNVTTAAGELDDYGTCAAGDTETRDAARALDSLSRGDGGTDVVGATT